MVHFFVLADVLIPDKKRSTAVVDAVPKNLNLVKPAQLALPPIVTRFVEPIRHSVTAVALLKTFEPILFNELQ
jgi:hypothetical protein